jgi:hypothetical protein
MPSCIDDDEKRSSEANDQLYATALGQVARQSGIMNLAKAYLGNSAHLWIWEEHSLAKGLGEVGFSGVRRVRYGECRRP